MVTLEQEMSQNYVWAIKVNIRVLTHTHVLYQAISQYKEQKEKIYI